MFTALYETSQYHTGKVLSVQDWIRVDSRTRTHFAFFIPHLLTPKPSKGTNSFEHHHVKHFNLQG